MLSQSKSGEVAIDMQVLNRNQSAAAPLADRKDSEAKPQTSDQEALLSCPVLMEIFHTPVIMSGCDHTVEEDTAKKVNVCPFCRSPKQNYPGYKLNRLVKDFVAKHLELHPEDKVRQHKPESPSLLQAGGLHAHYGALDERKDPLQAILLPAPVPAVRAAGARIESGCCGDCCNGDCGRCCGDLVDVCTRDPYCCALTIDDTCAGCSADGCSACCEVCSSYDCAGCPALDCMAVDGDAAIPCCVCIGGVLGVAAAAGAMAAATAYSVKEVVFSCKEPCPGGFIRGTIRSLAGAAAGYGTWMLTDGVSENVANYFNFPEIKPAVRCWMTTIGAATGVWVSGLVRVSRRGLFGGNAPAVVQDAEPAERERLLEAPARQM